jgi:DNA-binding transcriptional MerR regulator
MENFLSIQEFSKLSGIESSTLRYWDEIGLFSPAKRDPENNYRYYSSQQIISVNFIKVLSRIGVPLKTIGEMTDNRTPESILALIEQQEKRLDMEILRLRQTYSVMNTRKDLINFGRKAIRCFRLVNGKRVDDVNSTDEGEVVDISKVFIMRGDDINIVLGPRTKFKEGEPFYEPFADFCKAATKHLRINLNLPIGAQHDNWDRYMKAPGDPDNFFSIDPAGNSKIPAKDYLVGFTRGYYGQFGDLPDRMMNYIKENSLTTSGPVYATYLHDEVCMKDPSQYLVQVFVAVS